jgi:hypothetical protein
MTGYLNRLARRAEATRAAKAPSSLWGPAGLFGAPRPAGEAWAVHDLGTEATSVPSEDSALSDAAGSVALGTESPNVQSEWPAASPDRGASPARTAASSEPVTSSVRWAGGFVESAPSKEQSKSVEARPGECVAPPPSAPAEGFGTGPNLSREASSVPEKVMDRHNPALSGQTSETHAGPRPHPPDLPRRGQGHLGNASPIVPRAQRPSLDGPDSRPRRAAMETDALGRPAAAWTPAPDGPFAAAPLRVRSGSEPRVDVKIGSIVLDVRPEPQLVSPKPQTARPKRDATVPHNGARQLRRLYVRGY